MTTIQPMTHLSPHGEYWRNMTDEELSSAAGWCMQKGHHDGLAYERRRRMVMQQRGYQWAPREGIAHGPCLPTTYELNAIPDERDVYVGPYFGLHGLKSGSTPLNWH